MKPLTKEFLLNQGKCCKNNCKNCPWKRNKNMENKYPKLYKCSKDSFYEYILKEELRKTQGNIFHSNNYLNKDNVRLAYVETSSWGAGEIYMIAIDTSNLETLETVNKMIDGK